MTREQFEVLVAKLDDRARRDPRGYKLRVLLLALLGYGYLGVVVGVLVALFVGVLASAVYLKAAAVKLAFAIGALLWLVLRAMWVKLPPPAGRCVMPEQAPELFAMIEKLRRALKSPPFHRVLITSDFNAAVVQIPRLGMLGWNRNYLLLGLPLMKTLTVAQFEAVLAHEFGHLAGGHSRVSTWLYRVRRSWEQLVAALDAQKSWGTFMFRRFFGWYSPYFGAWSFPLARANEYEADAASARLTSPQVAAEALTSVHVIGSYLDERFWRDLHKHADDQPQPSFAPYAQLGDGLREKLDAAEVEHRMQRVLAGVTTTADTHPCLADRLSALQQPPNLTPPARGTGAHVLLEPALAAITKEFDEQWQASIKSSWERRYQEVQTGRARLAELDALANQQALSRNDALERAQLTESYTDDADSALAQFRAAHERAPDDPETCFLLGQRLLWSDDDAGAALVERAMAIDEQAIVAGCEALRNYHWRNGRKDAADVWNERMVTRQRLLDAARAERDALNVSDKFLLHGLDAGVIAELRTQLLRIDGVKKAYLVRKRVQHFEDRPLYVLGFVLGALAGLRGQRTQDAQKRIAADVAFPGETFILNLTKNAAFGRKLRWMRGARIL